MKILLIDDARSVKEAFMRVLHREPTEVEGKNTVIAKTFEKGMEEIKNGEWDLLILDNDLDDTNPQHEGYRVLNWLEEQALDHGKFNYIPKKILIVSSNKARSGKMQDLANRLTDIETLKKTYERLQKRPSVISKVIKKMRG